MRVLTLALLLGFAVLGLRALAQEEGGNRAYRRGDYGKAVDRYREAVARSGGSPRLQYNLGTALFRLDRSAEARKRLMEALEAQAPELRARAFYNLGNALARDPEGGTASAEELRAAIDAYRRSLLLDPGRDDARWNLELAMRWLEERQRNPPLQPPQQRPDVTPQGEGSGAEPRPQEGSGRPAFPRAGDARGPEETEGTLDASEAPFPRELAEQILRAVEGQERSLQREKLRRQRQRTRGPDW